MQALAAGVLRQCRLIPQQLAPFAAVPLCIRSLAQAAPALISPEPRGSAERTRHAPAGSIVRYPYPVQYFTPKPIKLFNLHGEQLGSVQLPGEVFNRPVRIDILHQVVRWQRAKARQGTHKVKDRSEVSGGGKKPWAQKGLGRARQGSIRAPHWRGGGVVHGPTPRSYFYPLNKKVRRLGLMCALSAKAHEGRLVLVDSLQPEFPKEPKTKLLAAQLQRLLLSSGVVQARFVRRGPEKKGAATQAPSKAQGDPAASDAAAEQQSEWPKYRQVEVELNALLVDAAKDGPDGGAALRRAGGNLPKVDIVPQIGANVYGILRRDVLIMTKAAAEALSERLLAPINRLGASGRSYQQRMRQRAEERQRTAAAQLQQLPYTQRPLSRSAPLFSEGDRQQLLQTR